MYSFKFVFLLLIVSLCEAYKILIVYNFPARSLSHLGAGFVKHLHKAGHEITYVTAYPLKDKPSKNFREIDISKNVLHLLDGASFNITTVIDKHENINDFDIKGTIDLAITVAEETYKNENLLAILQDSGEHFDVVLSDLFECEVNAGLAVLYECPMIWSYSIGAQASVLRIIDEASNPAFSTDYMSLNVPPLTFTQRVQELWFQIQRNYINEFIMNPKKEALYKKIFEPLLAKRGRVLPPYSEVLYNASLIFANEHNAIGNIPNVPHNFKLVGGQHIDNPAKPLPQDLQTIMDNAKNGVIYFSLGSIWKSKDMPKPIKDSLVKMFGQLKQTVIWKYEDKDLKNIPKNLFIVEWAPQQSILSHPNCLMFITHSGLLSSIEALFFGVPVIGAPVYFDQHVNARRAAENGYSLTVEISYNLADDLKKAIMTMLNNPTFKDKIKQLSQTYHDRMVSLDKEVVFWTEHVIRTHGAPHLRSPALQLSWYQKLYLDLLLLIIAFVLTAIYITSRFMRIAFRKETDSLRKKKN